MVVQIPPGDDPAAAVARIRSLFASDAVDAVAVGVSRIHTGIERISAAYREAEEALSYRMALGDRRVIDIDDVQKGPQIDRGQVLRLHDDVVKNLMVRNLTAAEDRLAALRSYLIAESASDEYVFLVFIELANRVSRLVYDLGFEMTEILNVSNFEVIQDLRRADGIEDLSRRLGAFMKSVADRLAVLTDVRHEAVLEESIRYVHEHYQENFGLEQAAERAGLSSAYFSKLFREKTGSSFVEYLTNTRVEEAKRLLRSGDLKISDIGVRVGYPNPSYFIRVFTKKTGVSPQRYRDAQ
jgi:two-component system response regulator YesN